MINEMNSIILWKKSLTQGARCTIIYKSDKECFCVQKSISYIGGRLGPDSRAEFLMILHKSEKTKPG
ncbi:hypothetical protein LG34_14495 [Eubacterium ramulus]|uniref:Uncharacterized protein n=1 Tax=Eubacterium ramulus TaxID=39490 RepID=A0A2V1JLZ4_EUBRA|nr:hypothetical protein LG34_14495 [Eubacterium ramulus]RHV70394.1 hypothetical protein DXB15_06435 [Roseburia sp. OM02-15]